MQDEFLADLQIGDNILVVETNRGNRLVAGGGREFNERGPMVVAVKCACGKGLKLNETHAGKRVKCPACSQILRVPSPQTSAAPHQATGRNLQHSQTAQQANSRNTPASKPGWQAGGNSLLAAVGFAVPQGLPAVNKGAKIAIYAYIVSIAAPILLMFIGFLVPGIVLLVHVVSAACMVAILLGYFCCLQVPEEPKAKLLIMIAGLCILLGTLGGLGWTAVGFTPMMVLPISISVLLQSAFLAVSFASFGLFLLFIRRIANWLKQSNVAEEAMLCFYLLIALTVLTLIAQGVVTFTMKESWSIVKNAAPSVKQQPLQQQVMDQVEQMKRGNEPLKPENMASLMETMKKQSQDLSRSAASMNPAVGSNGLGSSPIYIISFVLAVVSLVLTLILIIRLITLMDLIDFRLPSRNHGARPYRPGHHAGR